MAIAIHKLKLGESRKLTGEWLVNTMPGPCSAPNGDKSVVIDPEKREKLRKAGKLNTGKTAKKNK